jgi:hypothetical protein
VQHQGKITIPANCINGQCRLRIRTVAASESLSAANACTQQGAGEVEDYTLQVSGGTNGDLGLQVMPNPTQSDFIVRFYGNALP